jgi:hypothetical protein
MNQHRLDTHVREQHGHGAPGPHRLTPGAHLAGIAGGAVVALTGVWLLTAPFAFGYQPDGADWVEATSVGVVTGLGLLAAGLAVVGLLAAALRDDLAAHGLAKTKPAGRHTAPEPAAGDPASATTDLEHVLVPLAAALLEDLRAEQPTPPAHTGARRDGAERDHPGSRPTTPTH